MVALFFVDSSLNVSVIVSVIYFNGSIVDVVFSLLFILALFSVGISVNDSGGYVYACVSVVIDFSVLEISDVFIYEVRVSGPGELVVAN